MNTLKDVALKAGVSIATVSRVLGGEYPVSAVTKQRVLEAVGALDYHPNGVARSLRSAKTHTLGVLVPDLANPYFMKLIRAIENTVNDVGYHLLVASSSENANQERDLLRIFLEKRLDGVVIAPVSLNGSGVFSSFISEMVPVVFVDRTITGLFVDSVREEGRRSSQKLTNYLIDQGHSEIAIINRHGATSTANEREQGFRDAMLSAGIDIQKEYVVAGDYDQETGYRAGKRFLSLGKKTPTAVFCTNNLIALGLLQAVYEVGGHVPNDLSVVSFGDPFTADFISPKMTIVVQNPVQVGTQAARVLLRKLEGTETQERPEEIILPTSIRLGESVQRLNT